MQEFIGSALFALVCLVAICVGAYRTRRKKMAERIVPGMLWFLAVVICSYIAILLGFGFLWIFAAIGEFINRVYQWLAEAALYPFNWIF